MDWFWLSTPYADFLSMVSGYKIQSLFSFDQFVHVEVDQMNTNNNNHIRIRIIGKV